MQGTGNINFSFNKNNFNQYFTMGSLTFYPFYLVITIVCFIFLITLYYQKNMYKPGSINNIEHNSVLHFFKSLSLNSPFELITMNNKNTGFIGFSQKSYVILICVYAIAYFYLIQGILKNLVFSILVSFIQANPVNNPYNNPDCITKNSEQPTKRVIANYMAIVFLTIFFLIPFLAPYILRVLNIDNYDIEHSFILPWLILIVLIFPFFIIVIRHSGNQNINILGKINDYLEPKDHKYTSMIQSYFNTNYFSIFIFLFIILVYTLLHVIYYTYNTKNQSLTLVFILFNIFILIPFVLALFGINSIFGQLDVKGAENDIRDIEKNGIGNLYQLIVKYNYPCFRKS